MIDWTQRREELGARFWSKVEKTGTCWLWSGYRTEAGYGSFFLDGKPHNSHRVAYLLELGSVPEGLELDHLCRNRACVNPEHLEPVTHQENMRRGLVLKTKPQCKRGHEFTEENTYRGANQYGTITRKCKACHQMAQYKRKTKIQAMQERLAKGGEL